MKTEKHKQKKSVVQELRVIRDRIGMEIKDMPYSQLKKYVEEKLTLYPKTVWNKNVGLNK